MAADIEPSNAACDKFSSAVKASEAAASKESPAPDTSTGEVFREGNASKIDS
jgi:hypothetical protein